MERTFKYVLDFTHEQAISMPAGAEVLCVQMQGGNPCIWAVVDERMPLQERKFYIHGTGHPIAGLAVKRYIGTVQDGQYVWHVYEETDVLSKLKNVLS